MGFEILQGDCLAVLKTLENESVQCCVTSPPYYGLRSYQTPPVIWNSHNGCAHEWGHSLTDKKLRGTLTNIENSKEVFNKTLTDIHLSTGNFCLNCNAWRGELGLEPTFQIYISHLIEIFAEVKRVLKKDGTCFVNLGDSYVGGKGQSGGASADRQAERNSNGESLNKSHHNATAGFGVTRPGDGKQTVSPKSLMNIPARFAIAMTDELKMIQRNEIIWHKPACMPSSAKDRFTVDFEPIFFFAKNPKYKFNQQLEPTAPITPIRLAQNVAAQAGSVIVGGGYHEPMKAVGDPENRNKRTVWRINFEPQSEEHYASYPTKLVEPMILAGTDEGDMVLDIFNGTATTGITALRNRRQYIGIELNESYIEISKRRLAEIQVNLF